MPIDTNGFFVVVNNVETALDKVTVSHYTGTSSENAKLDAQWSWSSSDKQSFDLGDASPATAITASSDLHDFWTVSITASDPIKGHSTWNRDLYDAGFESADYDRAVVINVIGAGGTWGHDKDGPMVKMSFPVSSDSSFNLHT